MNGTVLTFYLCGNLLGLDILAVKEIDRHIEYTSVPDAPLHVVGLLNMRGQVVTLFNLAGLMGYERDKSPGGSTGIILKNTPGNPDFAGFIIDRPGSVIDIQDDMCEPTPANLSNAENKFISEVVKLKDGLLMLFNHEVLVNL